MEGALHISWKDYMKLFWLSRAEVWNKKNNMCAFLQQYFSKMSQEFFVVHHLLILINTILAVVTNTCYNESNESVKTSKTKNRL